MALLGVLLQTYSQVVIVAQYYANKDYIAKNLCENRAKPQMHCDGKCCLKKKLAKEGKEQAPGPRSQKNEEVVTLFCSSVKFDITYYAPASELRKYYHYDDLGTAAFSAPIFHPPAA